MLLSIKDFAASIGAARGTVKRWVHEGMPVERSGHVVRIDPMPARAWIEAHPRIRGVTFERRSFVYFARRLADGAIKIGFTSDIERRMREIDARLVAAVPGSKPLELILHARFAPARLDGREWFKPTPELVALAECLRRAA